MRRYRLPWDIVGPVAVIAGVLLLASGLAGVCDGAESKKKAKAPIKVACYKLIEHECEPEWSVALWQIEPSRVDMRVLQDGKLMLWTGPPGQYTVRAIKVNWETKVIAVEAITVIIEPPGPDPPGPDPPGPDPPGPNKEYQVLIILESDDLDNLEPGQKAIVAALTVREELRKKGHVFLGVVDKNTVLPKELAQWGEAAKGKPLPALLYAPKAGGEIKVVGLPETVEELWKALR